eukprot:6214457-Pleurochrysis_carterae.AAC.1
MFCLCGIGFCGSTRPKGAWRDAALRKDVSSVLIASVTVLRHGKFGPSFGAVFIQSGEFVVAADDAVAFACECSHRSHRIVERCLSSTQVYFVAFSGCAHLSHVLDQEDRVLETA